ncbi:MAG: DUF5719 family protein [Actinomycetota bacterium]
MRLPRELVAGALIAIAAAAGIAFDAASEFTAPVRSAPSPTRFVQRASFCPPPAERSGGRARIAIAVAGEESIPVDVEPGAAVEVSPDRLLVSPVIERSASSVTGLGAQAAASASASLEPPTQGAAAATCASAASDRWYLPAGTSALGSDERLLLFNPFLDEAVVRVVFFTPSGTSSKANLADVAVPAGRSVEVRVNEFVLREPRLGAAVLVTRGRVVAWRELLPATRKRPGVEMTLGARATAPVWYFPEGGVGKGYDETISLLNPSDDEAVVTITLASADKVVQPPQLVELAVAPHTIRTVSLAEVASQPTEPQGVSAWVTATNGVPVVAERTVRYDGKQRTGVSSEVGASEAARAWLLGPASLDPTRDAVAVLNPGSSDATLSLELIRAGGEPLMPARLRSIAVPAGLRAAVRIERWTRGRDAVAVVLSSSEPVIAERVAYSAADSDAAAVMGSPVTPTTE